jgi:hypothetical protein
MRRGIYRIRGKDGLSNDVRVEDDGLDFPVSEALYISRGYWPRVIDLPWQEDYVAPAPSEPPVEPLRARDPRASVAWWRRPDRG